MKIPNTEYRILNRQTLPNTEYRILNKKTAHSEFSIQNSVFFAFPGIFGPIRNPLGSTAFPDAGVYGTITAGLPAFISNVVKLVTIAAGVWMFGNLLTAGFMYLTSGGETEKITKAWGMIYQSLIGLLIIVSSFAITGVVSQLLFGNPNTILEMKIFGPGSP